MNNTGLGDQGAIAIFETLRHCPALATLELANNGIGDRAATVIGNVLKDNETLQGLSLFKVRHA